jgi:tetratricopeptide (TPR) repeat protein
MKSNIEAKEWNNRGLSALGIVQYEKAIECFNKAIESDPNLFEPYYNRGLAYNNLKEYEKAIEGYNKAIELNPDYAEAYHNRGLVYKDLGQPEKAKEDFYKEEEIKIKSGISAVEEPRASNEDWLAWLATITDKDAWDWYWALLIPAAFLVWYLFDVYLQFIRFIASEGKPNTFLGFLIILFVAAGGHCTFGGTCSLTRHIIKIIIANNQSLGDQLVGKDAWNWHWLWLTPLGLLMFYLVYAPENAFLHSHVFLACVGSLFIAGLAFLFMSFLSFGHHIKKLKRV